MAALRHVLRRSRVQILPAINVSSQSKCDFMYQGRRFLFSKEYLGLDNYERQRMVTADRLGDVKDQFCSRMETYIGGETPGTVFTDDLKTMLHITSSDRDFSTAEKMFRQYTEQDKEMALMGKFSFGPIIMRLLHLLNKPDVACRLFFDQSLDGTFDNTSSFLLILDMLYDNKQYERVLEVFEVINKKEIRGLKYPNDCTTLTLAACYQMNSEESFNKMMEIFVGCQERGATLTQRSTSFAAMLALNQNRPEAAMEVLAIKNDERLLTSQNLKAITLSRLGRFEEATQILKHVIQRDVPHQFRRGNEVFSDTIKEIEQSMEGRDAENAKRQFQTVVQKLAHGGHISDKSLQEFISQPIIKQRQMQTSFKSRRRSDDEYQPRYQREGLSDMN